MAKIKVGFEAKLYRNTGTYEMPVWTEIALVKDLTNTLEKGEADISTRAGNGWRLRRGTLKDGSIEFGMLKDPEDTNYTALRTAFLNNTVIDIVALDGDVTTEGSNGIRFSGEVFNFSEDQQLEEGIGNTVTIRPSYATDTNGALIVPEEFTVPAP